jgi:hypothetical protein
VISFDMAIAKRSRPTKLQPETKKRLLDAIATGAHLETACTSVGICYQTMREWIARGEGRDPERPKAREFAEFAEEIQQALAKAELRLVELVSQSAFDDPRQANWILERRYPHHWSKASQIRLEVDRQLEETLALLQSRLSPSAFAEVLSALTSDSDR